MTEYKKAKSWCWYDGSSDQRHRLVKFSRQLSLYVINSSRLVNSTPLRGIQGPVFRSIVVVYPYDVLISYVLIIFLTVYSTAAFLRLDWMKEFAEVFQGFVVLQDPSIKLHPRHFIG